MMLSSTQPASPHAPNATESPMGSSSRMVPTTAPEVATTQSSAPIFSPRSAAAATLSAFAQVPMTNSNQNAVVSSQPRVLSTGSAPAVVSADAVAFKGEHKRQLSNTAPTAGAASSLKGASTGGDPQVPSSHYHPHRSSHHPIMVPLYLGSLPAFANPSQNQANQQMIYTHAAYQAAAAAAERGYHNGNRHLPHHHGMPVMMFPANNNNKNNNASSTPLAARSLQLMGQQQSHPQHCSQPPQKKAKVECYNRKDKSLSMLAESLIGKSMKDTPIGTTVSIDGLAKELGVERRRIYDVVNTFQSTRMCVRGGQEDDVDAQLGISPAKNSYIWYGMTLVEDSLRELQQAAIERFPTEARLTGLVVAPGNDDHNKENQESLTDLPRSLTSTAKQFLMTFLVGHTRMSLPRAIEIMEGRSYNDRDLAELAWDSSSKTKGQPLPVEDELQMRSLAHKGLKTKIRRLYDVSNVLCAMGILTKVADHKLSALDKKPQFDWTFSKSPQELFQSPQKDHAVSEASSGRLSSSMNQSLALVISQEDDTTSSNHSSQPLLSQDGSTASTQTDGF